MGRGAGMPGVRIARALRGRAMFNVTCEQCGIEFESYRDIDGRWKAAPREDFFWICPVIAAKLNRDGSIPLSEDCEHRKTAFAAANGNRPAHSGPRALPRAVEA
jgi:hypothetical protein